MSKDVQKKREKLFWMQSALLGFLIFVASLTFVSFNDMQVQKEIKIFFAPFLSLVPLIFALTVIKDWIKRFIETDYEKKDIIKYSVIAIISAVGFVFITQLLAAISATEIFIAVIIAIASILSFI
ncbi:MAG: hypothetical protein MI922_00275, partial [Bacteroidales bacterium]|nr:hypothetical protein [Bacteroidales bacterium]